MPYPNGTVPSPTFVQNVEVALRDLGYPRYVSRSLVELRMVELGFLAYRTKPKQGSYGKSTTGRMNREWISISMTKIVAPNGRRYKYRTGAHGGKSTSYEQAD